MNQNTLNSQIESDLKQVENRSSLLALKEKYLRLSNTSEMEGRLEYASGCENACTLISQLISQLDELESPRFTTEETYG